MEENMNYEDAVKQLNEIVQLLEKGIFLRKIA